MSQKFFRLHGVDQSLEGFPFLVFAGFSLAFGKLNVRGRGSEEKSEVRGKGAGRRRQGDAADSECFAASQMEGSV